MSQTRTIHSALFLSSLVGLSIGMVLVATPTYAAGYYGRHYGGHRGGHHGRHYGGHHIYSYGHHRHRYRPYYYSYSTNRPHTYGRRPNPTAAPYAPPSSGGGVIVGSRPESPDTPYDASTSGGPTTPRVTDSDDPGRSRNSRPGTMRDGGWALLADGRYAPALQTFASDAMSQPTKATPKVGYALAAAGLGDLSRGVWAMRRALRIDPDAVHSVTIDEPLRPRLQHLVNQYQQLLDRTGDNRETVFMLASLHYLLRDTASARISIELAIQEGDSTSGAANLRRLIDELPAPITARDQQDVLPSTDPAHDGTS